MKFILLLPLLLFILLVMNQPPTTATGHEIKILNISTNKTIYHSNELLTMYVWFEAPEGSILLIKGIKDSRGDYRMDIRRNASTNPERIEFRLPRCNRCNGLPPGRYSIDVMLLSESGSDRGKIEIELQQ
jgi:hypothetical protein